MNIADSIPVFHKQLRHSLLLFLLLSRLAVAADPAGSGAKVQHGAKMRVLFSDFKQVTDSKTGRKEYVFFISFFDLAIPKQPLLLRLGDEVAGFRIAEFTKREPQILPCDGIKPGTESTLQLIHIESGEKYTLELARGQVVPRDR
ncbi:MAG: hypothetical protein M3463_14005 [Verrucomicrobiota bacterium]|nr:hypothetical protein [Verrucomicrobiota bacterium]